MGGVLEAMKACFRGVWCDAFGGYDEAVAGVTRFITAFLFLQINSERGVRPYADAVLKGIRWGGFGGCDEAVSEVTRNGN